MARVLGIDANKVTVRAVVLKTSYRKVTIEGLGEVDVARAGSEAAAIRAAVELCSPKRPLAPGAPVGANEPPPSRSASAFRPDAAAVALSGEKSLYRRLELPIAAQKEIGNVLAFELEATVPYEMDDAVHDYAILKRDPGSTMLPILAAVAKTEDVRDRIRVVREAIGIEPERVATGPLPLANLATVMPEIEKPPPPVAGLPSPSGPVAVLDLGETTTEVLILSNGEPVFARTLSRGTIGLPDSAPVLARELRQTFAAWRTLGGAPLRGMYLTGSGSYAQGAEHFLSVELGVTILPLPKPKLDGISADDEPRMARFAKALGIALGLTGRARGLNLRRGALEAERSYPFLREKIPLLAGLGAAILVSFGFSVVAELRTLDAEHDLLVARLQAASRDVLGEETDDPDHARELLEQGPGADEDPLPRVDAFDVMVQLSKAVPKDVVHDIVELDVNRGHVVVQGTVAKVNDAETILAGMKENKCFKDAKISRTSQFNDQKQKYVLEFDLKCETAKKKPAGGSPADSSAPAAGSAKPDKDGKP